MNAPLRVCVLTPAGRGAVATIALVGADAPSLIAHSLHSAQRQGGNAAPQSAIATAPVGQIRLAAWGNADGEQVVVCRQSTERFEIHCHGGVAAIEAIVGDLVAAGAQRVAWADFVASETPGRIAAAALVALASARTERTAAILLDQYRGALLQALKKARDLLAGGDLPAAVTTLQELSARGRVGLHLVEPFRVTLAGPPNVGKSSLINALVGYQRAIVHNEPGTTRDVLTAQTAIAGWPVELSDTAGVRTSDDELEQAGVARARTAARESDLVLLVRDATATETTADEALRAELPVALLVRNKCDLLASNATGADGEVSTSARTGAGMDQLLAEIARRLCPIELPEGTAVPFTAEQMTAIELTINAARSGDAMLATALLSEWID